MHTRTILAAIMLFVPITVAKVQAAPEDKPNSIYNGSEYQTGELSPARRYYRHAVVRYRELVIQKQEATDGWLQRTRGLELIARMKRDLGTNPSGWDRLWCARYISQLTGRNGKRSVNLASNWQYEGTPAPRFAVGSIGVSEGHVLVVAPGGDCPSGTFNSISGNSVGRKVAYMCAQRSSYFSFRWVSLANTKIASIPVPKSRPEFPPLPKSNPEPRIYEVNLPSEAHQVNYESFNLFSLEYDGVAPRFDPIYSQYDLDTPPPPRFTRTGPFMVPVRPEVMQPGDREKIIERDEIAEYLCNVYRRTPRKVDNTGDFTWKDIAAAKRMKMDLCQYVIGGMSRAAQKAFYKVGKKLDSLGIRWSILSAFRDDYRQRIAEGIKACNSCSLHGGSRWGGYGNGQAIDVTLVGNEEDGPLKAGNIFAKYGPHFGLRRPMPGYDPAHIQLADISAHKKPWRWFARREEPARPQPEPEIKIASINKQVPLAGIRKVYALVREEASKYGLDARHIMVFAYLENGGSWTGLDHETTTSAAGILGLTALERRRMGQKDDTLASQVKAGVRHLYDDFQGMKTALKRDPTAQDLYTAHWLGLGAGLSVVKASDNDSLREVIDRGERGLGAKAIAANPALRKMNSVGEFKRALEIRFREAEGEIRV